MKSNKNRQVSGGVERGTTIRTIKFEELDRDFGIPQVRVAMNQAAVDEYEALDDEGVKLDPVHVFTTPIGAVLVDGHHRAAAARNSGRTTIRAEIHEGTVNDAVAYALKANSKHGLRMSNEDKRHAVGIARTYWPEESNRMLADRCGVSDKFVAKVCASTANGSQSEKRVGRDGRKRPARMPARVDQAAAKPASAAPAVTTPPPAAEQLPPTALCPPVVAPLPSSGAPDVQQASPTARPDLMAAWAAASSAERSIFLGRVVANVPLAEHTAAWGAISGKILVAYEKPSSAPNVVAMQTISVPRALPVRAPTIDGGVS